MASPQLSDQAAADHAPRAKQAIERVCARADVAAAPAFYSPRFVDHVNDFEYHGLNGVRESVSLYRLVLPDLQMTVEEQMVDGERVVSRWRAYGTNRGRRIELWGITTSRFDDDGLIAEDWSASDNLSLVRQLGVWRTALLGLDYLRSRLRARRRS
ncbi:MAG: ester cyclase [Actinomycetota bacterium]|nr:ester cyclase [Actinomycetota bacterium]